MKIGKEIWTTVILGIDLWKGVLEVLKVHVNFLMKKDIEKELKINFVAKI